MNPTEFIAEIALPEHVSSLPPLLVVCLLLAGFTTVAVIAWLSLRHYRHLAPLRAAQKTLQRLSPDQPDLAMQTHALLKRTAFAYAPREHIAALNQQQWQQWLDSHLPAAKQGQWPQLIGNPYAPQPQHGGEQLLRHTRLTLRALSRAKTVDPIHTNEH